MRQNLAPMRKIVNAVGEGLCVLLVSLCHRVRPSYRKWIYAGQWRNHCMCFQEGKWCLRVKCHVVGDGGIHLASIVACRNPLPPDGAVGCHFAIRGHTLRSRVMSKQSLSPDIDCISDMRNRSRRPPQEGHCSFSLSNGICQ
jgi:hypothetical protein